MDMSFNPFSLKGKTILITGATSGIGRQCAIDCSKMGAKVLVVGRNIERLDCLMPELCGEKAQYVYDLQNIEGIKELILNIVADHGKLDGFIHSAGVEITKPVKLTSSEDYDYLYKINCLSAFEIVKYLNGLTLNRGGSIVLISSILSVIARKGLSAYAASKGAIISVARVMALEMSSREVRVNSISPGTILTPMMQHVLEEMDEEDRKKRLDGFPLGLGNTTDVSNACIYLLSDASRWITGQNIVVDGGYTTQ